MGGESRCITLSMLRDEIKDYPFASAFTFVQNINQSSKLKTRSLAGNTEKKAFFEPFDERTAAGVSELTRAVLHFYPTIPRVFKSMDVDLCHFVILKEGKHLPVTISPLRP